MERPVLVELSTYTEKGKYKEKEEQDKTTSRWRETGQERLLVCPPLLPRSPTQDTRGCGGGDPAGQSHNQRPRRAEDRWSPGHREAASSVSRSPHETQAWDPAWPAPTRLLRPVLGVHTSSGYPRTTSLLMFQSVIFDCKLGVQLWTPHVCHTSQQHPVCHFLHHLSFLTAISGRPAILANLCDCLSLWPCHPMVGLGGT